MTALAVAVLLLMAACGRPPTWYEAVCLQKGYAEGSPAYQACVAREVEWIKRQQGAPPAGN